MRKAVVLLSGGLDSSTALACAIADGFEPIALSVNYGQRHIKELESAKYISKHFGVEQHFILDVNLSLWGGSALTDKNIDVPTKSTEAIPVTYVAGRNTVFISLALSVGETQGASAIYLGINAVDYSGYPDCRPEYLEQFQSLANFSSKQAVEGSPIQLIAPLITMSKVDIVRKALDLGVPIDQTWSCYQGGEKPCGVCDSCRIRNEAMKEINLADFKLSLSPL